MKATTVQRLLDLNRQFYQQFAHPFAETRQRLQPGVKRILERIPMDARILDIGCGSGELAHKLARRGFRGVYVGIDFSQALLDVARRRLAEANTSTTSRRIPSPKNNPSDRPHTPSLLTTTDKDPTSSSPSGEQDQRSEANPPHLSHSPLGEGDQGGEANPSGEAVAGREAPLNLWGGIPNPLWPYLKPLARQMRHKPTPAEEALWQALRSRHLEGVKFRRQHTLERFILDFYSHEARLAIEVDGPIHQYTPQEDAIRAEYLHSLGIRLLRFSNEQVLSRLDEVLTHIRHTLSPPPSPLQEENREREANPPHISPSPLGKGDKGGEAYPSGKGDQGDEAYPSGKGDQGREANPPHISPSPKGEGEQGGEAYPSGERDQGDEAYSPPEASFHFLLTDLSSPSWPAALPLSQFDIVLAFSVLHHLPGRDLRLAVLRQIHDLLAPEGVFIHSEWQFQNSPRLAARIQPWELINLSAEEVDPDDALLDWRRTSKPRPAKDAPGLRYVHQFSEEELAALAAEAGFRILETFYSDGAEGNLGLYQLWKRIQPPR